MAIFGGMIRLAALIALLAAPAAADIADEPDITARLLIAGEVDILRRQCPEVEARRVQGTAYLMGIANLAMSKGYSRAEIEAYVENEAEEARLRKIVRQRLRAKGARRGDVAAHCAVARAEMAAGTQVGRLLR